MISAIGIYFFSAPKQRREVGWFRTALYLFLLYKVTVYILHFGTLFSAGAMVYAPSLISGGLRDGAFLLSNYYSVPMAAGWIVTMALLSLLGLFRRSCYITNAVLWLLMLNMNHYLYSTLTAGDYLLNQLLFFNIFFYTGRSGARLGSLREALHNMALAGIKVQVCLVYVVAAGFKLGDAGWMSGTAVYQTFQMTEYGNALLRSFPLWLCMILNYATVAYQLLFPLTVWFRPFKIYLLAFGILQHLVIALGMGLFSFGIVMIICYILFLKYDEGSPEHAQSPIAQT